MEMKQIEQTNSQSSSKSGSDYIAERLVRLVAVGLKEASMDSPCFRASMNHLHVSVLDLRQTLQDLLIFFQKYTTLRNSFVALNDEFLLLFSPIADGTVKFINKDIARPCIEKTVEGTSVIFENVLQLLDVDASMLTSIHTLLESDIPQYFELRRNFDTIQNKYDIILAKYMSLPKSYEPYKTKEDAFQLFEIRKQYIHVSLSLWIAVKKLESKVSNCVTAISDSLWHSYENRTTVGGASFCEFFGLSHIIKQIRRLKYCSELQQVSYKSLIKDLIKARANSEEGVIHLYTPSSELSSFDPSTINDTNLYLETENKQYEKHGWVFIRSQKLNSKEIVWVKRWLFIKGEVFGFLATAQDGDYVQESDKIGVMLANIKYLPSEDRKFCFEVKTYLTDLTIQVETLTELKGWLSVFKNVKLKAIESKSEYASSRYEPIVEELKLVPVVAKDLELVNVLKQSSAVKESTDLINQQLDNVKYSMSINAPLETKYTELSCLSHLYLSATTVPSSVTANFWGFVNWGLYYVIDQDTKEKIQKNTSNLSPKSMINLKYPDFYPTELRFADIELRSIFESYIPSNEYVLLHFKASWSPNSSQELFCNLYITHNSFYVYTNNCGLISILPLPLNNFLYTEVIDKANYDVLKVYFVSGMSIKMKIFQGSSHAIRDQINFILQNKRSKHSKGLKEVITELSHINRMFEKLEEQEALACIKITNEDKPSDVARSDLIENARALKNKEIITVPGLTVVDREDKLNYGSTMDLLWMKKYDIPAKALFHMLFGDESFLLHCTLPLASSIFNDATTKHTIWRCDSKQRLSRVVWNSVFKVACAKQVIEKMVNNKYYNIVQETPNLKLVFGINRKITMRFIIYSPDSKSSKIMVYHSLDRENNVLNWFTKTIIQQIMIFRMEALDNRLTAASAQIRHEKRKIASAIKTYGAITKYDSDQPSTDEINFNKSVSFLPLQLFSSFYYEKINFEFERFLHVMIKNIMHGFSMLFNTIQIHLVLIILLLFSGILNMWLLGKTGRSYWRERHVEQFVNGVSNDEYIIYHAIGMKELEDILWPNTTDVSIDEEGSACFWAFLESENLLDVTGPLDRPDQIMSGKLTSLRIERNELLTKLNVLNYLERSYILKEWKRWVIKEVGNCELIKNQYGDKFNTELKEYCDSALREMEYLYNVLL